MAEMATRAASGLRPWILALGGLLLLTGLAFLAGGAILAILAPHGRGARGGCSACGYDLRGLSGGRCPECGWMQRNSGGTGLHPTKEQLGTAERWMVRGILLMLAGAAALLVP